MKFRHCAMVLVAAVCLAASLSSASAREWMSADGKYKITADLVDSDGTLVRLQVENGSVISVPLDKLSPADQAFVTEKLGKPAPVTDPGNLSEDQIKQQLTALGVRVGSVSLSVEDEAKLTTLFTDLEKSRRLLFKASKDLAVIENQLSGIKQAIINLELLNVQLNGALTRINPTDFAENNRIVGALNANQLQAGLYQKQQAQIEESVRKTRGETNKVREAYIEDILALRKVADEIQAKLNTLAKDPKAQQLVAQLNTATDKEYAFASRTFDSSLKKLKAVEDTVLSESIKLRREPSGTQYVSVMIDGKHSVEMVLDSGASLICLPDKMARECGVEVGTGAKDIILVLADGREIQGKLVTLPSVRVGKFTLENVEAAVLGPEAIRAEPLLGMSFLEQFKFEIDAQDNTLKMVKIEAG